MAETPPSKPVRIPVLMYDDDADDADVCDVCDVGVEIMENNDIKEIKDRRKKIEQCNSELIRAIKENPFKFLYGAVHHREMFVEYLEDHVHATIKFNEAMVSLYLARNAETEVRSEGPTTLREVRSEGPTTLREVRSEGPTTLREVPSVESGTTTRPVISPLAQCAVQFVMADNFIATLNHIIATYDVIWGMACSSILQCYKMLNEVEGGRRPSRKDRKDAKLPFKPFAELIQSSDLVFAAGREYIKLVDNYNHDVETINEHVSNLIRIVNYVRNVNVVLPKLP
jgi:hypothetical protein